MLIYCDRKHPQEPEPQNNHRQTQDYHKRFLAYLPVDKDGTLDGKAQNRLNVEVEPPNDTDNNFVTVGRWSEQTPN
jgi:hypothetical protein